MNLSEKDIEWFLWVRDCVYDAGFATEIAWSQSVKAPHDDRAFAVEVIFVICNSGMKAQVAKKIFERIMKALRGRRSSSKVFGHVGKCAAIDRVWRERRQLFADFNAAADKVAFCESLPWIGTITKWHLAKNFGVDVAKPDRHLERIAKHFGTSTKELCEAFAAATGYRIATVDVILWRACNLGIIDSNRLA